MEQNNNLKQQNKQRRNDEVSDSGSDMEEEHENLDVVKRIQDITNEDQLNPKIVYKNQVNASQKILNEKNEVEIENENEEEDEEEKNMVNEEYDMVNVDLNFYDPNERQFHSIKNLVNGYLDGLSYNSSDLADLVIKQVQVGTMVGIDDPDEQDQQNIFGFTTTMPLDLYKNEKVIKEIANFITEKSVKHNQQHENLMKILENPQIKTGLLINERILNCSPFIVPTLHTQFLEDLKWVKEDDPEEGAKYNFDYLLVVSKVFKANKFDKTTKKHKSNNVLDEYIYQKFEDYKFLQRSQQFFVFEAQNTKNQGGVTNHNQDVQSQICYRVVYLIKWSQYQQTVPQLQQELLDMHELQQQKELLQQQQQQQEQ